MKVQEPNSPFRSAIQIIQKLQGDLHNIVEVAGPSMDERVSSAIEDASFRASQAIDRLVPHHDAYTIDLNPSDIEEERKNLDAFGADIADV